MDETPKINGDATPSGGSAGAAGQGNSANVNTNTASGGNATGGDPSATASAQSHQHTTIAPVFAPQFVIAPQVAPTTGYGSTGAFIASHPKEQREEALAKLLPDIRVEAYTGGPDVTCLIVNRGGGKGKVAVKARLNPVHSLFQVRRSYDITAGTTLSPHIGETTVRLMHISGNDVILDGTGDKSWSFVEYHPVVRSGFDPITLELRYVIEPFMGDRPIETIRITYTPPSYRQPATFNVEKVNG